MGFTKFYWVLLGFTGLYWVLLGFTGFYLVSIDCSCFTVCFTFISRNKMAPFHTEKLGKTRYNFVFFSKKNKQAKHPIQFRSNLIRSPKPVLVLLLTLIWFDILIFFKSFFFAFFFLFCGTEASCGQIFADCWFPSLRWHFHDVRYLFRIPPPPSNTQ